MYKSKLYLSLFLVIAFYFPGAAQEQLPPCPSSPNCVCTQDHRAHKRLPPIAYTGSLAEAKAQLQALIAQLPKTQLITEKETYLHYTFTTKIGHFTDDVVFLFDTNTSTIHFRSASRKGWSDLRANRRRMKKITKLFLLNRTD